MPDQGILHGPESLHLTTVILSNKHLDVNVDDPRCAGDVYFICGVTSLKLVSATAPAKAPFSPDVVGLCWVVIPGQSHCMTRQNALSPVCLNHTTALRWCADTVCWKGVVLRQLNFMKYLKCLFKKKGISAVQSDDSHWTATRRTPAAALYRIISVYAQIGLCA